MTGTSTVWPPNTTVIEPSKAGAWVIVPVASVMPETPSGSVGVDRVRSTPLVSVRVVAASASTSSGVGPSSPPPPPLPPSSPEQADRTGRARTRAATVVVSRPDVRARASMSSAFHRGGCVTGVRARRRAGRDLGRDRGGHRRDGLRSRHARAVAPAVGLGQADGRTARRGRAGRTGAGPGGDEGVLALEEAVAADAAGGAPLAGVLGERRHLDRAGLGAGQGRGGAGR